MEQALVDMNTTLEQDLWREFTRGSQEAFRALYDRYAEVLYAFGRRYTFDAELIKDCVHDLFLDLHTYRTGLSQPVNVRFYLLKSFRRKLHLALKKPTLLSLDRWISTEHALPMGTFTFGIEEEIVADEKQREALHALARELNELPARQREILYLKFKHELDYDEIAAIMQISVPTCRTFVYRAVKQLRTRLEGFSVAYLFLLLFA